MDLKIWVVNPRRKLVFFGAHRWPRWLAIIISLTMPSLVWMSMGGVRIRSNVWELVPIASTLENNPLISSPPPCTHYWFDVGKIWEIWIPKICRQDLMSLMRMQLCIFIVYYFRKYGCLIWPTLGENMIYGFHYRVNILLIYLNYLLSLYCCYFHLRKRYLTHLWCVRFTPIRCTLHREGLWKQININFLHNAGVPLS